MLRHPALVRKVPIAVPEIVGKEPGYKCISDKEVMISFVFINAKAYPVCLLFYIGRRVLSCCTDACVETSVSSK